MSDACSVNRSTLPGIKPLIYEYDQKLDYEKVTNIITKMGPNLLGRRHPGPHLCIDVQLTQYHKAALKSPAPCPHWW